MGNVPKPARVAGIVAAKYPRRPGAKRAISPPSRRARHRATMRAMSDIAPGIAFDVKGASVLHMLRGYLGAERFREAIRTYVAKNQDRAVVSEDLREIGRAHV